MCAISCRLLPAFVLLLLAASGASACKYAPGPFLNALAAETAACRNELCGRIYPTDPARHTRDRSSCGSDPWLMLSRDMRAAIDSGGVVVLGEAHDNAVHHRLRAKLADGDEVLLKGTNEGAFVLEQIRADQSEGLARFYDHAKAGGTLADFKRAVDWERSGWQKYDYDPLLEALIASKRPILPGDPPRDTIKKLAKEGPSALGEDERQRLALDKPLGAAADAASAEEIEGSHCGMLQKEAVPRMAFAQRYRDASLADATLEAAEEHGAAILMTGNNHARLDRGAPWYIHARAPDKKVVSVMLIEVEDGKTDPGAYIPRDPDGQPAADYVVFTPRNDARGDPCEGMRKKQ